jgi:hypothetical protein
MEDIFFENSTQLEDEVTFDFFIQDGWGGLYIKNLLGLDFNVANTLLLVAGLWVLIRSYKVLKKYMLKKSLTKQWGRLSDHF